MKFYLLVVMLMIAAHLCSAEVAPNKGWVNSLKPKGEAKTQITLASNGKAAYAIIIPDNPTTQDKKAAADLNQWLMHITRADFEIRKESEAGNRNKVISIGRTALAARAKLSNARLCRDGYEIAVDNNNLFLLGGTGRGTINAVYALLEEDLGCRWYDNQTATIPNVSELTFRPVPRRFVPVLDIRDPYYLDAFDGVWSLRNRTNSPRAAVPQDWGGNTNYATGYFVHTFNKLVPPDQYFADHPEYFSMVNGVRTKQQLCLTNPDVLKIAIAKVKEVLRSDPNAELISVSQNDGPGYCECPKCKAVTEEEGSLSGPLLNFVNAVADAIADEFPNVKVITLAYQGTFTPPKTIKPRPNVAIQLCTDSHAWPEPFLTIPETQKFKNAMQGWAAIGASIYVWDYTINYHNYLAPMPNMPIVTPDIRFFIDNNAKGVMLQGCYQCPGSADAKMRCWVWAKQLWDPSLDTQSLIRDFNYGYYGASAEPMQQYQNMLWDIWEKNHAGSLKSISIWYPMTIPIFTDGFLDKSWAIFDQAEKLADNQETLHRVELAELPVLYVDLTQRFIKLAATGKCDDRERYIGMLDKFETIAHREKVTFVREENRSGGNADEWIDKLRNAVEGDSARVLKWNASTDKGDISVTRMTALWKFAPDPDNQGVTNKWFASSFDDSAWSFIRTDFASGWESQGFPNTIGYGWYRRSIDLPLDYVGKHIYLYFGAVDEDAYVYINEKLVFDHSCDTLKLTPEVIWDKPFFFELGADITLGKPNTLAVRVYNRRGMGGIWKPVYIVASDLQLEQAAIESAVGKEPKL